MVSATHTLIKMSIFEYMHHIYHFIIQYILLVTCVIFYEIVEKPFSLHTPMYCKRDTDVNFADYHCILLVGLQKANNFLKIHSLYIRRRSVNVL